MAKGKAGIWIAIFVGFFIILIGFLVYFGIKNDWFSSKLEVPLFNKTVYIKLIDDETSNPISGNFTFEYIFNGQNLVAEGRVLEDEVYEVKLPKQDVFYEVYCWSDNHYVKKFVYQEASIRDQDVLRCNPRRFSNLSVSHTGLLDEGNIVLNVTSPHTFLRIDVCISWSPGIYSVYYDDAVSKCENNIWNNYTIYLPPNKTSDKPYYEWLPIGTYVCKYRTADEAYEQCISTIGSLCYIQKPEVPTRYKSRVDSCYNTGKFIQPEKVPSETFEFTVNPTTFFNCNDKVGIYLIDKTRTKINNQWVVSHSTSDNKDLGMLDFYYEIKPKNC